MDAIRPLYPKLAPSGYLLIDDYGHWIQCQRAIDDYFQLERGWMPALTPSDYTGAIRMSDAVICAQLNEAAGLCAIEAAKKRRKQQQVLPLERSRLVQRAVHQPLQALPLCAQPIVAVAFSAAGPSRRRIGLWRRNAGEHR